MGPQPRLSLKAKQIQPSPIRKILSKAQAAKRQGLHITDLSVGRPDFDTPVHIKEAAHRAMDQGHVHYTASAGIGELRECICRQVLKETGVAYRPEQVLVTAGATEAIYIALQAILNPGDEILAPEPMFVYYAGDATLCGAGADFSRRTRSPKSLPRQCHGSRASLCQPAGLSTALPMRTHS